LQADGWWVRKEIIWHKPNPMPESCTDRPTSAHEKIYLMTKSERYFYDADAVRERAEFGEPNSPGSIKSPHGQGFTRRAIGAKGNANGFRGGSYVNGAPGPRTSTGNTKPDKQRGHSRRHAGFNERWDAMSKAEQQAMSRNLRDVWTIACEPFPDAHFATFPTRLAETCIKAGCPPGGTVLDPFGGSGTTGMVADRLGRAAILIEINPEYVAIAKRRLARDRLARKRGTMEDVAAAALEPTPLEALMGAE
jgi:DNA modification methylase